MLLFEANTDISMFNQYLEIREYANTPTTEKRFAKRNISNGLSRSLRGEQGFSTLCY